MLRRIVDSYLERQGVPPDDRSFASVIGIIDVASPTDVAHRDRDYREEALSSRYSKKMGER
ncbi:MAG: hypothetical protein V3T05_12910 [Myxococcota bacterium]